MQAADSTSSRPSRPRRENINNLYIKNFTEEDIPDEGTLRTMFAEFGEITSTFIPRDFVSGQQRGFAFVCFRYPEMATRALAALSGRKMSSGSELYVNIATKKSGRVHVGGGHKRPMDVSNLFVKNLPDNWTSNEQLRREFEGFGPIRSVRLMKDINGVSRGFGFVAFERPEDSARAMVTMNNRILGNKVLYVSIAQRREERNHFLSQKFHSFAGMAKNMSAYLQANATYGFRPMPQISQ